MFINGLMDKEDVMCVCVCSVYIQWNITESYNRRKSCHFATWLDLQGIMLSEISQIRETNTI